MSLSLTTRRSVLAMGRRMAARRFESTASSSASSSASTTASKAAETAKEAAARASSATAQGLSRVTSAAGPAIVGAAKGLSGALTRVGGPTAQLVGFIERQIPFVIYYSRVGIELSRLVFIGQKMAPPPASTFQTYFQGIWKQLQNPAQLLQQTSATSASLVQNARGVSTKQLVTVGVIVAECLGFFTVGEMIGRFKLIGYHGESPAAHH